MIDASNKKIMFQILVIIEYAMSAFILAILTELKQN